LLQATAFRDQFRSMRRLVVLASLVVAAAEPTDQVAKPAKAKLQNFHEFAAPRQRAQRGSRRKKRKGQATALPTTGAWNASSLAEPWREPWYEHWSRGRADGRAAWARLDAYERAWERVVSGATVARPMEAPGTNRRLFVMVAVQRTGSTWLVRELDRHPCLRVGAELFLDARPCVEINH
jgi:hypothetical protein